MIADATYTTQQATRKQESLEKEFTQTQEAFQKSNAELEGRLQKVHDKVREEGRIALWSFKNPLVSRIGNFMANWGGWTLGAFGGATAAAGLAAHGPTLAQSCSSLSSLSALGQCTAAVVAPSLLVPVVATTVLGLIIFKVKQVAQKIFTHKRKEEALKAGIQQLAKDNRHQIDGILKAKAECSEQIKESTQSSEVAQKETEALKKAQTEVDTALKTVRDRLHSDTLNQAIGQIETGLGLPDDPTVAVAKYQLTVPATKIALNAMLGMVENHAGQPRAIAQGPAQPVIAGPAIASAADVEPIREDDGTGIGPDII